MSPRSRVALPDLRRFAVHRTFFGPTTLAQALDRFGFVQADPIRAPARAQDLTLRHRVDDYRAGDLERSYAALDVEEETFINYGFVTRAVHRLMHPREQASWKSKRQQARSQAVLEFVRERGVVHPREVDRQFAHGSVKNYWGGSSSVTTHLLNEMHYRGLVRVARREAGVKLYAVNELVGEGEGDEGAERRTRIDRLIDVVIGKYAPLPGPVLANVINRIRYAVPQWQSAIREASRDVKMRLSHERVEGVDWYWPAGEDVREVQPHDTVRLMAPFDPLVWDRRRFELFWGWAYRFEAYTPAAKRQFGYYALPLLWRDRVIGWGNLSVKDGQLRSDLGYIGARPRDRAFRRELDAELHRMSLFLAAEGGE